MNSFAETLNDASETSWWMCRIGWDIKVEVHGFAEECCVEMQVVAEAVSAINHDTPPNVDQMTGNEYLKTFHQSDFFSCGGVQQPSSQEAKQPSD